MRFLQNLQGCRRMKKVGDHWCLVGRYRNIEKLILYTRHEWNEGPPVARVPYSSQTNPLRLLRVRCIIYYERFKFKSIDGFFTL